MSFKTMGYKDRQHYREILRLQHQRYRQRTGAGQYPRLSFLPEEDDLILKHGMPDRELAEKLKRSVESIQLRRYRLKKKMVQAD